MYIHNWKGNAAGPALFRLHPQKELTYTVMVRPSQQIHQFKLQKLYFFATNTLFVEMDKALLYWYVLV